MRCCPKCGARFEDSDIRSMCGSCMVSLVPLKDDPAAASQMDAPGPISVGPIAPFMPDIPPVTVAMPEMSVPDMRLPDIPMPAMPPEVPAAPGTPEPQPGPIPSPFTPQPEPDYPQPTIIPEPEPQPAPMPTPSEPPPEPVPVAEAVAPSPSSEQPHVPYQQTALPNLLTGNAAKIPEAPKPAMARQSGSAPAVRTQRPAGTPLAGKTADNIAATRRALTAEEEGSSRSVSIGQAVLAGIALLIAFLVLINTDEDNFNLFTLVLIGGFVTLAIYLIRQAIYHSAIQSVKFTTHANPRLGGPLRFDVYIGAMRKLPVTDASITITGRERAVQGSGKSQSSYLHTIFSRTIPIGLPGFLDGGSMLVFHPQTLLPADTMPTFSGSYNHIEWSATLHVGIPGWYPDIKQRAVITIPPINIGTLPATSPHRYALPNLNDLQATISFDCAATKENIPLLPAGHPLPFTLEMQPKEDGANKKLWVELIYVVTGSGDTERNTVERVACFRQGWKAGVAQREQGTLTLPVSIPITYSGHFLRIQWGLNVRTEVPWAADRQQAFEVMVVPDAKSE